MHGSNKQNNLKGQTSPYLLQHLHNPVDWYPWGKEALEKSAGEDKPILVSIGYSSCHWCHVMEKESFEDEEIAAIMNRHFVCIKVDREERPDIDHMYMTAVQLLTRQGGWPLNCFALPDTRPFWGGTYFKKEQWKSILIQVAGLYRDRRKDVEEQADQLTQGIVSSVLAEPPEKENRLDQDMAAEIFDGVMDYMDRKEGGTLHAPKFPLPVNLEFLLHYHYHSGKKEALDHVDLTLEKMAMGGIFDQAGGGFARYSTDENWKVPHFEKMLYDNGQLLSAYSKAWKVRRKDIFRDVVYRTAGFIEREMTSPRGLFYTALDADSEGEEGKYYVWTKEEADRVLGDGAPLINDYYNIGKKGYWENGNNILLRDETDLDFAVRHGIDVKDLKELVERANDRLLEARSGRERPLLDNKVIVSWNALMIRGLADAYSAFGNDRFLRMAVRAADFILDNSISPKGKLYRCLNGTSPSIDGFLEDYAQLVAALTRLYEVSAVPGYLLAARDLTYYVLHNFTEGNSDMFPFSSDKGEKLKAPFYELPDNVIPSSNSVMAHNLYRLAAYFEKPEWEERSMRMLDSITPHMEQSPISYTNWARLAMYRVYDFHTLVITGSRASEEAQKAGRIYLPDIAVAASISKVDGIPLFEGRHKDGETWFYLCTMGRCNLPVRDLGEALVQLRRDQNHSEHRDHNNPEV